MLEDYFRSLIESNDRTYAILASILIESQLCGAQLQGGPLFSEYLRLFGTISTHSLHSDSESQRASLLAWSG